MYKVRYKVGSGLYSFGDDPDRDSATRTRTHDIVTRKHETNDQQTDPVPSKYVVMGDAAVPCAWQAKPSWGASDVYLYTNVLSSSTWCCT